MISADFCQKVTLHQFQSEHELLCAIERLSYTYNHDPQNIEQLYEDPLYASAYLYYYFATNVTKASELATKIKLKKFLCVHTPWIEFGAGPGSVTVGVWDYLKKGQNPILLLEKSQFMRSIADKVFELIAPDRQLLISEKLHDKDWIEKFQNGVLCFAHSYNEISENEFYRLIDVFQPQTIWLMEPGTQKVFDRLVKLREPLIRMGYNILYPCLGHGSCRLETVHSKSTHQLDWCHQFIKVSHDPSIERICQLLRKDRKLMPFCQFLYTKKSQNQSDRHDVMCGRIIRVKEQTKHSYEWEICDDEQKIIKIQVMKRGLSSEQKNRCAQSMAGDMITFQIDKVLDSKSHQSHQESLYKKQYWRILVSP